MKKRLKQNREPWYFDFSKLAEHEREFIAQYIFEAWVEDLEFSDAIQKSIMESSPVLDVGDTLTIDHSLTITPFVLKLLLKTIRSER